MPFTDEDLKRLKEQVEEDPGINHDVFLRRDRLDAVLARLEAAEAVLNLGHIASCCVHQNDLNCVVRARKIAWKKSCGN